MRFKFHSVADNIQHGLAPLEGVIRTLFIPPNEKPFSHREWVVRMTHAGEEWFLVVNYQPRH